MLTRDKNAYSSLLQTFLKRANEIFVQFSKIATKTWKSRLTVDLSGAGDKRPTERQQ